MLAVLAAIKAYKEGLVTKIIVTRPAVEVEDEKIGFLPGTLNDKMAPWTRPIFDVMKEYYSTKELAYMLEEEIIEIAPLAFMRGRTFKDCYIIFDEAQLSTSNQMKMMLTRIGDGAKLIVTGDVCQVDRRGSSHKNNGLQDFIDRLDQSPRPAAISVVTFAHKDIQRHPLITDILKMYGES